MKHKIKLLLLFSLHFGQMKSQTIIHGSNNGKYIVIDKMKIYYEEYGKGTPLLLLHGGLGSINNFHNVIPELAKYHRVIAFDRPGHGRSEHADTFTYHTMAAITATFIEKMNLDSAYIVGWSDGGNIALITGSLIPKRIKKIIACGADVKEVKLDPQLQEYMNTITPEFVEKNWQEWLNQYKTLTPQFSKWKKFIANTAAMWQNPDILNESKLRTISCSTLVVIGDRDVISPEAALKMYRSIKGSQLCIV
ncbi:MAG TPA: alpha/beta fold hydrolase, partial [Chitinophagaceae bacterium]|nr:alpha/beta fold hydrolase [Chitinophagaceae bacterium]